MLKQRADEYFPLRDDHEKPHLRWAAGYPEGTVRPGRPKRETYPGYTRYQERIQADVDGMRFWSTMHMLKTHSTSQLLVFWHPSDLQCLTCTPSEANLCPKMGAPHCCSSAPPSSTRTPICKHTLNCSACSDMHCRAMCMTAGCACCQGRRTFLSHQQKCILIPVHTTMSLDEWRLYLQGCKVLPAIRAAGYL